MYQNRENYLFNSPDKLFQVPWDSLTSVFCCLQSVLQNTELIKDTGHSLYKSLLASLLFELFCLQSGEVTSEFFDQGYTVQSSGSWRDLYKAMLEGRSEESGSEETGSSKQALMIVDSYIGVVSWSAPEQ